jgi:parallel beta-helix repeat protein
MDQVSVSTIELTTNRHPVRESSLANYTEHSPIFIEGNSDFETQGWPGNGSASNPYLIAGLNITTNVTCIEIRYTSVHFTIRDCYFSSSTYGYCINLQIVTSALISNCTFEGRSGLYMYSANNVVFLDNIMNSTCYPIRAHQSYGFQVINCTVPEGYRGCFPYRLSLDRCNNAVIEGNEFRDIYISPGGSIGLTVTSNNFTEGGVLLDGFSPFMFYDVSGNLVDGKPLLFLEGNESLVIEADDYGQVILIECTDVLLQNGNKSDTCPVQLYKCTGCSVVNITGWRGYSTIYDYGSNYTTIRDCEFNGIIGPGIFMTRCGYSLIENCTSYPGEIGFHDSWSVVQSCSNTTMTRCTIYNRQSEALYFTGESMVLSNCTIQGARYGVHVRGINMTIVSNQMHSMSSQNTQPFFSTGIYASWVNNCTFSNNLIENGDDYGIFAITNHTTFENNTIINNEGIGIELFNGSWGNILYGNILKHNLQGNALDNGYDNQWDDGISVGNLWDDFNPHTHTEYLIPGTAGSVDRYPTTDTEFPEPSTSSPVTTPSTTPNPTNQTIIIVVIIAIGAIGVCIVIFILHLKLR